MTTFEFTEIISKIGVHTGHFEIWRISDNKKTKLATAFKRENAEFLIQALEVWQEKESETAWRNYIRHTFSGKHR